MHTGPVIADVLAVVDGQQDDVEDGLVRVGKQAHGGASDGSARALDVGAKDAVADRGNLVDRPGNADAHHLAAGLEVQVGMNEPLAHGLDQFRGLPRTFQPSQVLVDPEGLLRVGLQAGGLQVGSQSVQHLLVGRLQAGIVDRAGRPDVPPQGLADIDEPNQLQTYMTGEEF